MDQLSGLERLLFDKGGLAGHGRRFYASLALAAKDRAGLRKVYSLLPLLGHRKAGESRVAVWETGQSMVCFYHPQTYRVDLVCEQPHSRRMVLARQESISVEPVPLICGLLSERGLEDGLSEHFPEWQWSFPATDVDFKQALSGLTQTSLLGQALSTKPACLKSYSGTTCRLLPPDIERFHRADINVIVTSLDDRSCLLILRSLCRAIELIGDCYTTSVRMRIWSESGRWILKMTPEIGSLDVEVVFADGRTCTLWVDPYSMNDIYNFFEACIFEDLSWADRGIEGWTRHESHG